MFVRVPVAGYELQTWAYGEFDTKLDIVEAGTSIALVNSRLHLWRRSILRVPPADILVVQAAINQPANPVPHPAVPHPPTPPAILNAPIDSIEAMVLADEAPQQGTPSNPWDLTGPDDDATYTVNVPIETLARRPGAMLQPYKSRNWTKCR